MAITFVYKNRETNNSWVEVRGDYSDLIGGYYALNHDQYWVINDNRGQTTINLIRRIIGDRPRLI